MGWWTLAWLRDQGMLQGVAWPRLCYSFKGDTVHSPSDLIDLRSSSILLSYSENTIPIDSHSRCSLSSTISTLWLDPLAPEENELRSNPLKVQHYDSLKMADNFVPPGQQRYTRACMVCSIIMTQAVSKYLRCIAFALLQRPCNNFATPYPLQSRDPSFFVYPRSHVRNRPNH